MPAVYLLIPASLPIRDLLDREFNNVGEFLGYLAILASTDQLSAFALRCAHPHESQTKRRSVTIVAALILTALFDAAIRDGAERVTNLALTNEAGMRTVVITFAAIQMLRCGHVLRVAVLLRRNPNATQRLRNSMGWLIVCLTLALGWLSLIVARPSLPHPFGHQVLELGAAATGLALSLAGLAGPISQLRSRVRVLV